MSHDREEDRRWGDDSQLSQGAVRPEKERWEESGLRVDLRSPVRVNCTQGSARGTPGNWRSYLNLPKKWTHQFSPSPSHCCSQSAQSQAIDIAFLWRETRNTSPGNRIRPRVLIHTRKLPTVGRSISCGNSGSPVYCGRKIGVGE